MRVLLVIAIPLVVVLVAAYATSVRRRPMRPTGAEDDGRYRNHQAMARWIERLLHDDMVRPVIPGEQRDTATRLLAEFYGDDPKELR